MNLLNHDHVVYHADIHGNPKWSPPLVRLCRGYEAHVTSNANAMLTDPRIHVIGFSPAMPTASESGDDLLCITIIYQERLDVSESDTDDMGDLPVFTGDLPF